MKRNYGLDLMRIFLCLLVIGIHSLGYFKMDNDTVGIIITAFLVQANGLFYMISGYFNLEKEMKNNMDIKKYYKNKVIYILLPFLAFVFVWTVWDYLHVNGSLNIPNLLFTFYESVMNSLCDGHLWFLYPLFGLLLSSPFLSKMLHNMNEKELKILWYVALGWNVVSCYLTQNLGIGFRFSAWIFDGWIIYYFAGYYYRHVIANESKLKWTILGVSGFVITVCGMLFFKRFEGATDMQIMYTFFCVGCLMLFDKGVNIKNTKLQRVITFISKNTFMIYLFHLRAMEYVVRKLSITGRNFGNGILVILLTFIGALIAAEVANLCLKPIQKFIDKKWVIKEN